METIIQELCEYQTNKIYMKREDLLPFCFGGNKARKAELFFQKIDEGGFDCVVTYGSSSSNHCRVVANLAAARGIPCYLISPLESSYPTFNETLMQAFHARIRVVPVEEVHDTITRTVKELEEKGARPYFIPGGGHGNLGTKAYMECYEEIRAYEKRENQFFDYVFHASGTGTTQAGLICGQIVHQEKRNIVGISIARKNPYGKRVVEESVREYLKNIGVEVPDPVIEEKTIFLDDYIQGGYGKREEEVEKLSRKIMLQYGIPMDHTYVGKAFYGMLRYIESNSVSNSSLLFLHTGGTPLFFDDIKNWEREENI